VLIFFLKSGDGAEILLVEANKPPTELRDRWRVVQKMTMIPQYAFAGDYTGSFNRLSTSSLF